MRPAIIASRWRWRSPRRAPPNPAQSWVLPRFPCRTPASSRSLRASRQPVAVDKIYLVGFMAAGKTTVARALADRLGWRAEDVDELIEARERRPVADIFARSGEPYCRAPARLRPRPPADQRQRVPAGRNRGADPRRLAA